MKINPVKIHIKNFQSIDDLEIEVNGFTCITGPSNIGKSAIIRATSSAILNNPVVNMVRKGTTFTTVEISSKDWAFKWEKNDKGVNRVFIPPSAEKALDKLGQTQVLEIAQMGFGSIEIGDDEIQPWFAPQFEPLFLLNQSGPRVTDFLSEVSRLMTLQDAIVLAARGKRASTDKAKTKSDESNALKTKLSKIIALDSLEKLGKDLEEQAKSIEQYETRIRIGESFIAKRIEAERIISIFDKIEAFRIPKDNCGDTVKKVQELYNLCFQLESAAVKIRSVHPITKINVPTAPTEYVEKVRGLQKFAKIEPLRQSVCLLEDISKIKTPDVKKIYDELDRMKKMSNFAAQIQSLQVSVALLDKRITVPVVIKEVEKLQKISEFSKHIKTCSEDISNLELQIKKNIHELFEVEQEIASIPSCPTCNRPLGTQHTGKHKKLSA